MRSRIDISEVEQGTKIRAKYLRALENEEWEQLPGPAYVKSFLRTYAEALGLDAKLLVEEYKLRHERLSETELQPIRPGPPVRRRAPAARIPRGAVVAVIVLGLIGALYWLGRSSDDNPAQTTQADPPSTTRTDGSRTSAGGDEQDDDGRPSRRSASRRVRLRVEATAPVYVCLEAGGRQLIAGETFQAGQRSRTFRARRFRINLGNGAANLRINGRLRDVPESSDPIGYEITRRGRRALPDGQRPDCEP